MTVEQYNNRQIPLTTTTTTTKATTTKATTTTATATTTKIAKKVCKLNRIVNNNSILLSLQIWLGIDKKYMGRQIIAPMQ